MRSADAKPTSAPGGRLYSLGPLGSGSALLGRCFALLGPTSRTQTPIHLFGESGSGKQTLGLAVHLVSRRKSLVSIRCTGLSSADLRQLLVGDGTPREPGAGSGLSRARAGTLLLLDVGGLEPESQSLLVGLLGADMCLGRGGRLASVPGPRLVSTSAQDLEHLVRRGRFRPDLYYPLCGAVGFVPPLRKRPEDILDLARLFLGSVTSQGSLTDFSFHAQELLLGYAWPGNVRQLRTVVEAAAAHSAGGQITHAALGHFLVRAVSPPAVHITVGTSLADAEKLVIRATLAAYSGSRQATADALGIARRTLYDKLRAYKEQESGDPERDGPVKLESTQPWSALQEIEAELREKGPVFDKPLADVLAAVSAGDLGED